MPSKPACVPASRRRRSAWCLVAVIGFAALGVAALPATVAAQDCGIWLPVAGAGNAVLGVAYAAGKFVGVGTLGAHTSPDGASWTVWPIALDGDALVRVAWNGSLWVAVGDNGRLFTSGDGEVWTPRTSQTAQDLAGVAWGNGTWVAVGDRETIITSPDGIAWSQVHAVPSGYLSSVVWTGSGFVAVGAGGVVRTSATGATWAPGAIAGEDWLTDVIWTGSQLVVVSYDGTVLAAPAPGSWTPLAETGQQLRRVLWTGGRYVAGGSDTVLLASPDAVTWEPETIDGDPPNGGITGLAWSGTVGVAVGSPPGVFRSHCGAWAEFSFTPAMPQIGEKTSFFATTAQGFGRARWDFGEVGCDGAAPMRELACFSAPCTFPTTFTFAVPGEKTIRLSGWTGEYDDQEERIYVLLRTKTLTVAATGACSTCTPPGAPSNPSPAHLAITAGGTVMLGWSAPALGTPPFTYDVEVDGATVCQATSALQCQVTGVEESSTHHLWRVTARNACGEKASTQWKFLACTAPARPLAGFDWSPAGPLATWPAQQQPYPGQEVAFHDLSTNAPDEWAWSGLPAGGLVSEPSPYATWWSPGDHEIGLWAGNCLGWSDQTTAAFTVHPDVRPRRWAFDFGTGTSPLAAGFVRVPGGTAYSPARGHGWASGSPVARERALGDDLDRDFHFAADATFVVNLPARTYDVTLWLGDSGYAHDEMGIYLEGQLWDLVSTAAGEVARRVLRVPVADGQLTVRLRDRGGLDPNVVVNGIEVVPADPLRVDFGTTGSPVEPGFVGASEGTRWNAPLWCGWSAGKVASRDRASGSDLRRDFNMTQDGTFTCALGRGVWNLKPTLGDALVAHDQVGILLEGQPVGVVSTPAGQFLAPQYRVRVGDGTLTLRLDDAGGTDVNAVIDGLEAARVGPFDFGTPASPVMAGYTAVSHTTRYSGATGFGWLAGTVGSRDRGTGGDLLRDINITADATFAVDVPNGAYDVSVIMGDATNAHDEMAVLIEGIEVAVVATAKGQSFARTFRTTVADSQLSLRLVDLGGADASLVINAVAVAPAP